MARYVKGFCTVEGPPTPLCRIPACQKQEMTLLSNFLFTQGTGMSSGNPSLPDKRLSFPVLVPPGREGGRREGGLTIVFCTGNVALGSMIETSRWGSCLVVFLATFFQLSIFNFQAGGSEKHPVKQSSPKMLVLPPLGG